MRRHAHGCGLAGSTDTDGSCSSPETCTAQAAVWQQGSCIQAASQAASHSVPCALPAAAASASGQAGAFGGSWQQGVRVTWRQAVQDCQRSAGCGSWAPAPQPVQSACTRTSRHRASASASSSRGSCSFRHKRRLLLLTSLPGLHNRIACCERRCIPCRCCQRSCLPGSCCPATHRATAWPLSGLRCPPSCTQCQMWRGLEVGARALAVC